MIKVNLPQLCTDYYNLKQIAQSFSAQLQLAETVRNNLRSSTELEKLKPALDRVLTAGEEQRQELLRMTQVIDTVCQYYSVCENRIVDQCENAVITYPTRTVEFVNLSDAAEALRDMGLIGRRDDQHGS